ncbi:DUF1150 family protein [Yoonia sp. 2307UL14-13]|uniref:DUF1150 family protein n=1 Tax=Yoonia sp. 2307UL14-13 TaxID=3126506 RepID=UPI0030B721D2
MNSKFDLKAMGEGIVYVKPVAVADLPDEVQEHAGDLETLFSVHNADGERLALVANEQLAFHLAREHQMHPVTVH